jgi:putative acetyltransferase
VTVELRCERPGDEEAVDVVNCRAFGRMQEANLVRLLRMYHPAFDQRYSLTAWDGGRMVGHTLFTPADLRLMGRTVRALAVGPVAVVPDRQRQGIGGQMLRLGHETGRRDGYALAFLWGHPSYYPRFGYRPCHGAAALHLDVDRVPQPTVPLAPMPVRADDAGWIARQHAAELADVDFAWPWGPNLHEWWFPGVDAVVWWTEDGRRAAYTLKDHLVLAEDAAIARKVIANLRPKKLDQHPSGRLARQLAGCDWARAEVTAHDAAMACELQEGVLSDCLRAVAAGERPIGTAFFPLPFLAC